MTADLGERFCERIKKNGAKSISENIDNFHAPGVYTWGFSPEIEAGNFGCLKRPFFYFLKINMKKTDFYTV